MPRPNNFWDVLAETANYAGEAIPAAQRENRQIAQERERFGLRAQQERDQFNETRRYHDAQIGLQGARLSQHKDPTYHPSWPQLRADFILDPNRFPEDVRERIQHYMDQEDARKEPQPKEPKAPPNFIADIGADYDRRMNTYNIQMARANQTGIVPVQPTMLGSFNRFKGEFPRNYLGFPNGVDRDSIATGVGIQPWELNVVEGLPPANGPHSGIRQNPPVKAPNPPAATQNTPVAGQNTLLNDLSILSDGELDSLIAQRRQQQ